MTSAKEDAAERAAGLVRGAQVAALATLHGGDPGIGMVPFAVVHEPLMFVVHLSALAAHTRDMAAHPKVALLIMESVSPGQVPHTLARVTIGGTSVRLATSDPRYAAARSAYARRFPEMSGLFELGDFALFAVRPDTVRVVTGFAQAATIAPETFARALQR